MTAAIIAWHYTTGDKAVLILESGELRPTDCNVPAWEEPVLWFSLRQSWEPTATKGFVDARTGRRRDATLTEMHRLGGGVVRFGVDAARLIRWPALAKAAHMRSATARGLEKSGRSKGAVPSDWLGSLQPVPLADVLHLQQFNGETWRDLPLFGEVSA